MFQCIIQQRNGWIHAPNPEMRDVFPGNFEYTTIRSTQFENKYAKNSFRQVFDSRVANGKCLLARVRMM